MKQTKVDRTKSGSQHLGQLIMLLQRLEKHPHTFGEAGPLTPSEIHTIDAIGVERGVLMSELANRLQVTKGAVTQIIVRLEDKNLVERTPNPTDSRSVIVSLTKKGKSAFRAHEEVHLRFYRELSSQLNEQEIEIFEKCIEKLCTHLRK
ncbi:DNA-binding MarR family transcriptional regulator [Bacillus pakistanensis]|uniref:DNA-binding MarR family transcriptional regulator n=1 Tax=Rossellomorea pakistanensis TaxID=992288 RepID=A0ABS2NBY7_9BACI|nr:MarR family transcriptional regulator [Bacillus pakistanensis]MBM7585358.1 DNA-binding MarR family transcriptional regulator [Bacillus pakistanensis]